jgi:CheY-like chemotaxis protein
MSQRTKPTVLLVEDDPSLRRLITLGLQYRGMHVIAANSPTSLPTVEAHSPDLLVLDVDGGVKSDPSLLTTMQADPFLSTLPIVLLAWECPLPAHVASDHQNTPQAQPTCLTKPFDARTLHATIDQQLLASALQKTTKTQELPLAAQTRTPAPSIWPLLTAAGLLLAFIGLMGPLAFTGLGLLIIVVSLLWWTLGTNTKTRTYPMSVGNT